MLQDNRAQRSSKSFTLPIDDREFLLSDEMRPLRFAMEYAKTELALRKMHLAMRANALAVFPGGFGTLDELFEILTLLHSQKAPPVPAVRAGAVSYTHLTLPTNREV